MTRRLRLVPVVGVVLVLASSPAGGSAAEVRPRVVRADAYAAAVTRPDGSRHGSTRLRVRDGRETARGGYRDAAVVVARSHELTRAGTATGAAMAASHSEIGGIRLLGGRIVLAAAGTYARAASDRGGSSATVRTFVRGLVVDGIAIDAAPNLVVPIDGVGTLIVREEADAVRLARGRRSFAAALHLRIEQDTGDLPAGSEIVIGYAGAAAASPRGAVATPTSTDRPARDATPTAPVDAERPVLAEGQTTVPVEQPSAPPTEQLLPAAPQRFDSSGTQAPPPGGFTRTPPIDEADRSRLLSGGYVFPVIGGAGFDDDFGGPRAAVANGFHQGIDLFASLGTPVVAVHDGWLFNVGWNRLGGWRMWLVDEAGTLFYYAHLAAYSPLAVDGARVRAGDVIGFMGQSGDAATTPVHLHFEIHPRGAWAIAPYEYLRAWPQVTGSPGVAITAGSATTATTTGAPSSAPRPEGLEPIEIVDIATAPPLDAGALDAAAGAGEGATTPPDAVTALDPPGEGFAGAQ